MLKLKNCLFQWDTVTLNGKLSDLREQFARLLQMVRTPDASWLLPIVACVLERIQLQHDHPYNFDLGTDGTGLDKAVMASESARKLTFDHWPHMHYRFVYRFLAFHWKWRMKCC